VDSWFAFWLSSKSDSKKSSTSARYKGVVDRFLAFLGKRTGENIANINAADIRNFRTQESRGGRAARTANFSVKVIRTAFNHALKLGYITVNPCHALDQLGETESKVEAFSLPQINALLAVADAEWRGAILMGCYAGMALDDAANITWDSIDLAEEIITYKRGKTDGQAIMGLHPTLRDFLLSLPTHDEATKPIFTSLAKRDTSSLSKSFSRLIKSAGISRPVTKEAKGKGRTRYSLGFHSLRHTFVSDLARGGVAEDVRKKMAAHQTSAAHAVYTHHDAEVYRQAVAKLPAVTLPDGTE
jgi:integrase